MHICHVQSHRLKALGTSTHQAPRMTQLSGIRMSTRLLDEMRDLMRRDQLQGTPGVRSRGLAQSAAYAARVPASGIPVAAAVARVTERRSSGSMLCRRVLPAQRAIIEASPAFALSLGS